MLKVSARNLIHKWTAALLVFAFAIGAAGTQTARAASLVVTNTSDSGPGSLRQAIADALPGDTIAFDPSLAGGTITLTSGQLEITRDLTISGPGTSQLAISGNNTDLVFLVRAGVTATIEGMTIRDGRSTSGGGIIHDGTLLTVNDITFTGNFVAAIDNRAMLIVNQSTFSDNSGGIMSVGPGVTVNDSTFINNSPASGIGGGILSFNNAGTLTVSNSTFTGNSADQGGAIYTTGITTINNSTFTGNSAGEGGGIQNIGTLTVNDSTFTGNSAVIGGGIRNFNDSTLTVRNSTFSSNFANNGGGILNDGAQLTVSNSTFSGNAASFGGGIQNFGALTVKHSTFSDNSGNPGLGGGILNNDTLTLENTIVANSASGENCANYGSIVDTGGNLSWPDTTCPGINADPKLLALAGNGGPTGTMALDAGSAAIDAAVDANCLTTDQRGMTRPQGPHCDIGAFELEQAAPDSTAPTITITTPADGAVYLLGQAVNADFSCQDEAGGSGLASCIGDVANGSPIDTSSLGNKNFMVDTADNAGNLASLTHNYSVVDATAPTITITTPANGALYQLGQVVNADYACQDEEGGSGLASCIGDVPNGSPIDTASVGPKSFTVSAADNAGNPASAMHNYSVVYNFSGFFQPVDNLPTLNLINAGKGVAVKFSLAGDQGLAIFATGYPISQQIACEGGAPLDTIEQTVTASSSSLSYDPATGTYIYKWKTEKAWAGTCRQLIVKLSDGTEHMANFKFK